MTAHIIQKEADSMSIQDEDTETESASIKLPELTDEDFVIAYQESNLDWCKRRLDEVPIGILFNAGNAVLYRVSKDTLRCHQVDADTISLVWLNMIKAGFEKVGAKLEITPYTVLRRSVVEPMESPSETIHIGAPEYAVEVV